MAPLCLLVHRGCNSGWKHLSKEFVGEENGQIEDVELDDLYLACRKVAMDLRDFFLSRLYYHLST